MKTTLIVIAILALVASAIGFSIWWEFYKYNDCKKVGHSTFYCVMKIGS